MKKWINKFTAAGVGICLSVSMLAGCGTKETEEKTETQTQEASSEAKTEKPETTVSEHPKFIPDGLRKVVLVQNGEEIFHISKEPADYKMDFDYWEILNPYDENVTVNTEEMYNLFEALCEFDFQTPVTVKEGTDTGLSDSDTGIILEFVDTQDSDTAKSTVYADSSAEIVLGNEDGEGNRFAAVKGKEDTVYKLSQATLDAVYALNPFDYILKIPVLVNIETLESIEITAGDKTYEMNVNTAEEEYKFGRKKADKDEFVTLYQDIASVMLDSELETEKDTAKDKEQKLSLVYHRNTENAPEITVTYYAYNDEMDSVEINGEERFLVKAADVDALIEKIKEAF